jgi:hypothetical protein
MAMGLTSSKTKREREREKRERELENILNKFTQDTG